MFYVIKIQISDDLTISPQLLVRGVTCVVMTGNIINNSYYQDCPSLLVTTINYHHSLLAFRHSLTGPGGQEVRGGGGGGGVSPVMKSECNL